MYGFEVRRSPCTTRAKGVIAKPVDRLLNKMCDYNVKGDWFCIRTH